MTPCGTDLEDDLWTDNEQAHWLAFDQLSGPGWA